MSRRRHTTALTRRATVATAALLALFGLVSTASPAGAGQPAPSGQKESARDIEHYVALGDSFAAGPLIPQQRRDPIGCARSTRNYPALVAGGLDVAEYVDVSCSRASTRHMTTAQVIPLGSNPPQFTALRAETDLVTVTIGGNDIGFTDIVLTCTRLSFSDPFGDPCRRQATAGGSDIYAERVLAATPKVAGVLRGIRERSPDATVLLVGYLRMLPPEGGCWPVVPIARGDVPYLDSVQRQLNKMLAQQAEAHGAWFIDSYAHSLGHDTCRPPGVKWVEGALSTTQAWPWHPNAAGMRAVADLTLTTLTSPPD